MGQIRYRRREAGDPESVTAFGRTFEDGEFVEVSDQMLAKARGNPTFEIQGEKSFGDDAKASRKPEGPEEDERRARAEVAREGVRETAKAKQAEALGRRHGDDRG